MFKHLDYLKEEPDLSVSTIEGTRYYKTPTGKMYPSITSVTSFYNRDVFVKWRKKVNQDTLVGLALIFFTIITMFAWIIYFYFQIFTPFDDIGIFT